MAAILASCSASPEGFKVETPGQIRVDDPIVVKVSEGFSFKDWQSGEKEVALKVKISPKVEFDVEFTDARTLCIYPRKRLEYNASYKVSLPAARLCGTRGGNSSFEVKTLAPFVRIAFGPLTCEPGTEDTFSMDVELSSDDPLDADYVKSGMKVKGSRCDTFWTHSEDNLMHVLSVGNIKLNKCPSALDFRYEYERYQLSGMRKFDLPAKGGFSVISSELLKEPLCYQIVFSSVIDASSDFSELVSMPGAGNLRFLAHNNVLKIYPAMRGEGDQFISISAGLKSSSGISLGSDYERYFPVPATEPFVEFMTKGVFLPSSEGMKLYFRSSNYAKARVRVRQIYESNVLQFLQDNRLNVTTHYIENVSRVIADTTFTLAKEGSSRLTSEAEYALDISGIVKVQKGAIYKVEIKGVEPLAEFEEEPWESDYYFGSYEDYDKRSRYILSTDLCAIAKGSDKGRYHIYVTDIISAKGVKAADVLVYNSVNQLIAKGQSDKDGVFEFKIDDDVPHTVVVSKGGDKTYLSMIEGNALSLSSFDVSGVSSGDGKKGYVYGDRGVWRPGDEIHISFVSMLDEGVLPESHPVSAILRNPDGLEVQNLVCAKGHSGMYAFDFKTSADAPTGNWDVEIICGGASFHKRVRIESVKPNNILVNLTIDDAPAVPASSVKGSISGKWQVGIPAAGLETRVEVALSKGKTRFDKYEKYIFEDQSRYFGGQARGLYRGVTDADGYARFDSDIDVSTSVPGMLDAVFTTRIFEKSGDFSIDRYATTVSPFNTYIGVALLEQENRWGEKFVDINRSHKLSLVALDRLGRPVQGAVPVEIELYRIGWSWWWSSSEGYLASYSRDSYDEPYSIVEGRIVDGRGEVRLDFSGQKSGFFFARIVDPNGGHATSKVFMVCREDENDRTSDSDAAAKLTIKTDREKYEPGQVAHIAIPSARGARALVSVEKGDNVVSSFWVECSDSQTEIALPIDGSMAPDVYLSVTLVQPHNTALNDAPIRMYGVKRLDVEDSESHLEPLIDAPGEVKPEGKVTISVREKHSKKMSYTLALVDEGLLSLTRFKTPNPWPALYATEALSVHTWDNYNLVIGAYGAKMEPVFAVGGDDEGDVTVPNAGAERFKPVSIFLGPFSLKPGEAGRHTIDIPQYIGKLRVMVVASDGRAVGSAEKSVSVTKPVMVKATLPRVLGTDEVISLPVTIFATKDNVGDVSVGVTAEGSISVASESSRKIHITRSGDQIVFFSLRSDSKEGQGSLKVVASCNGENSSDKVDIVVRNPIPQAVYSQSLLLSPGEKVKADIALAGAAGTNTARLEVSSIPPVNLSMRLAYLTEYPHACLEQLVSSAFPQLYLGRIEGTDDSAAANYESNVKSAIAKLPSYSLSAGGMSYWPGYADIRGANVWGSVYAAHFLVEAKKNGYAVPSSLYRSSLSYAAKIASDKSASLVSRAYACYVLSLAGTPERGQMNRLREDASIRLSPAAWFLAASYAIDGKKDVAGKIAEGINPSSFVEDESLESFGSEERNLAISSIVSSLLGDRKESFRIVMELSSKLNDRNHYMSTQSTSWALIAVSAFASSADDSKMDFSFIYGKEKVTVKNKKPLTVVPLKCGESSTISASMVNNSSVPVYVVVNSKGVPSKGGELASQSGIRLNVSYTLLDGNALDPSSIEQGTDFIISTFVSNPSASRSVDNLALTQILPSGWEIRHDETGGIRQEFRDDRVCSYFDLAPGGAVSVKVRATAAYKGHFYHPATLCEAMYDNSVSASTAGQWCDVR